MSILVDKNAVDEVLKILRKSHGFSDTDKFRSSVIEAESYSDGEWRIVLDNSKLPLVGFSMGYLTTRQVNHIHFSKDSTILYFDKEVSGD